MYRWCCSMKCLTMFCESTESSDSHRSVKNWNFETKSSENSEVVFLLLLDATQRDFRQTVPKKVGTNLRLAIL